MTPEVAREFARYYQDEVGPVSEAEKTVHAATLRNPDGLPGIRVHLDTGVPPETVDDATIFGDWGGYTAVPPIKNSEGEWEGAKYSTAWQTHMHPSRLGIFRYALPYSDGGGQTKEEGFAFTFSIDSASGLVHESGHAMGLGHSGPKAITGGVDVNCKPHYHSLMNYAFNHRGYGFADGREFPSLNNKALKEWEAVPPSRTVLLNVLENDFKYYVDREKGHVDWNRDGTFAPKEKLVRAYANFRPGSSCEYTRYNKGLVHEEARSRRAPALARLDNRLYAFFVKDGMLSYTYSTSPWDCPTPGKESCGTWQTPKNLAVDAGRGVDVVKFGVGENAKLLIVTSSRKGQLWETRLSLDAQGRELRTERRLVSRAGGMGEPSLARVDTCAVYLAYKGRDGNLRQNQMTCASNWEWEGEKRAQAASGDTISIGSAASPAIARAYLPWRPALPSLYGAFTAADGRLDIWWFNGETELWEKTDVLETRPGLKGRPAMAWVPDQSNAETPGRFYLVFVRHNPANPPDNKARLVQMMMSYVKVTKRDDGGIEKSEKVGLLSDFDNSWHKAQGIDLLYESGIDTNLRILETLTSGELLFKPKADGINDFTYQNYNDWEVLRVGVCKYMVNPKNLVENPIKCPEKTWFD